MFSIKLLGLTLLRGGAVATLFVGILLLPVRSGAQPVPWFHPDGTVHWYHASPAPTGIDWAAASDTANQAGGYLVTVTSLEENDLVFNLLGNSDLWYSRPNGDLAGPWMGGFQPPGSQEPAGDWRWVTGEPFAYMNWTPGNPDDVGGNQDRIHFGEANTIQVPTWDDLEGDDPNIRGFVIELSAPVQTLGLFRNEPSSSDGYTLFAPMGFTTTYLVDGYGRLVHSWQGEHEPGLSAYLLEDGLLLRPAALESGQNDTFSAPGAGGRIQRIAWDGAVVWDFVYSSGQYLQHHDVAALQSGNVLLVAWELKTEEEALAAGRDPSLLSGAQLWPDHIVEVEQVGPTEGNIVWEWHVWDHLIQDYDPARENYGIVAEHAELIDINYVTNSGPDWTHLNAIDYNENLDQILVNSPHLNEFWVIDHSTTTQEAAGHTGGRSGMGGDILYRWGNAETYRAGGPENQKLFFQHDANWVDSGLPGEGNILVFNNGRGRPDGSYSSVMEIDTPADSSGTYPLPPPGVPHEPIDAVWNYTAEPPSSLSAGIVSGATRQPNGNTLVADGPRGDLFEVTSSGEIVWEYVCPVGSNGPLVQGDSLNAIEFPGGLVIFENMTFRTYRYPPGYPGLANHELTPGYPIEQYKNPFPASLGDQPADPKTIVDIQRIHPNPFRTSTTIHLATTVPGNLLADIIEPDGRRVRRLYQGYGEPGIRNLVWDGKNDHGRAVSSGVYFLRVTQDRHTEVRKVLLVE